VSEWDAICRAAGDRGEGVELDHEDAICGWYAGFAGEPEPHDSETHSFWLGWREGRLAAGWIAPKGGLRIDLAPYIELAKTIQEIADE
jgi:hypothetical protein